MRLSALLFASVLVLAGCSTNAVQEEIQPGDDVFSQTLNWIECEEGFECATVSAPLDWLDPQSDLIDLALVRKIDTSNLPVIFLNPGGPGVSGVKWFKEGYEGIGSSDLRQNFQLVSFDPRGTGDSSPVTCKDSNLKDELYYGQSPYTYGSAEDLANSQRLLAEFVESCETSYDTGYLNTQQAARDLELLRALSGSEQLDYLGFSYGTLLGATYAALFPDRVGKFVLDGAIDPTISSADSLKGQVIGFDAAFRAYLEDCLTKLTCPFQKDVDTAIAMVADFLQERERATLPTQIDRELSLSATLTGTIAALYSEDSWIYLTQAFNEAFAGDGTTFLLLADFYNDRDINGEYLSNLNEAHSAIDCADDRTTEAEAEILDAELNELSAVFGKYFSDSHLACENWPEGKSMVELDYTVALNNGPLVVGTTGDPATPYSQAVALSEMLDQAILLTLNGEGHTAYGSNICVDAIVEAYFRGEDIGTGNKTCN